MNRRVVLLLCSLLAVGGGYVIQQRTAPPPQEPWIPPTKAPEVPRPWRWATEAEWMVHDVARHLGSWGALSATTPPPRIKVVVRDAVAGTFVVTATSPSGSPILAVHRSAHMWDPATYDELARGLLCAGPPPASSEPTVAGYRDLLLSADSDALRRADRLLFAALKQHPRAAALHEQAALLWAAEALRADDWHDFFLTGAVAHLAAARACRAPSAAASIEERLAITVLDVLLDRQVEALATLDDLATHADPFVRSWVLALRLRVTHDPRLLPPSRPSSRLEQVAGIRALAVSRSCRVALDQARSWRMEPALDWVRAASKGRCAEPAASVLRELAARLQAEDAGRAIAQAPRLPAELIEALEAASRANTFEPALPTAVIPSFVRADEALRYVLVDTLAALQRVKRLGHPDTLKMFAVSVAGLREGMTLGPLLEHEIEQGSQGSQTSRQVCDRMARLASDRPDIFWAWNTFLACPTATMGLIKMVRHFNTPMIAHGTGRVRIGPWATGLDIAGPRVAEDAARRAPFSNYLAYYAPFHRHNSEDIPYAELRESHARLLDYDVAALTELTDRLFDDDDELVRMAERICALDVERCAAQAEVLYDVGRRDPAERLWKRALADADDQIDLSNNLHKYVALLMDRGDVEEALRVAQRAAKVYSGTGLVTLAYALERAGRFDEAARQHALVVERYGDREAENAFYIRYSLRHGTDRFASQVKVAMAEVFPHGLRRMGRAEAEQARLAGVYRYKETRVERHLGMRPTDRVVAVDGIAVETEEQYGVLWSLRGPEVAFVLRKNTGDGKWPYVEMRGRPRTIPHPVQKTAS
jgi:tetratricopeptide (TPR) repeat protein